MACRDPIAHEQLLEKRFRDKPFALIGVNLDNDPESAVKMIDRCGISWRNLQGGTDGGAIQSRWPVPHIPAIYVLDRNGIIRYTRISGAHLDNAVETLLAEAPKRPAT
ncbi:MAG: TlpA family protein disulfide reductase [Planctomycetes bacterium]|nr:TlpA family protein disulfide reductase [Planctomycetota bacterium]